MTKKKNVVTAAKTMTSMCLVLILLAGWLLASYTLFFDQAKQEQMNMVQEAREFLEDKLYIRAAKGYQTALETYQTEQNVTYEKELLDIYKAGGMEADYFELVDDRIAAGTATVEEYVDRAERYIQEGLERKAIPILQQGMEKHEEERLTEIYESISYAYTPTTTNYTSLQMPSEDWYIPAFDGEKWGYIGVNGRTVLDFVYEEVTRFSGNYAVVKLDGVYTLIDKKGYWNAVDKNSLDAVTAISGTKIVGMKDGNYGIYSNTFNRIGEENYSQVYLNDNGLIVAQKDGVWHVLNAKMEPVTEQTFTDVAVNSRGQVFANGYAVVADGSGYYLINKNGEACFEQRFADAKGMEGGLLAVADSSGKWGFVNERGELLVEHQYEDAYSFSNRLGAVRYAGKWGYINRYNTMMIEPQFETAVPFFEGNALVTEELGNYRILTLKHYKLF